MLVHSFKYLYRATRYTIPYPTSIDLNRSMHINCQCLLFHLRDLLFAAENIQGRFRRTKNAHILYTFSLIIVLEPNHTHRVWMCVNAELCNLDSRNTRNQTHNNGNMLSRGMTKDAYTTIFIVKVFCLF